MQASMSSLPFRTRFALTDMAQPASLRRDGADLRLAGFGELRGTGNAAELREGRGVGISDGLTLHASKYSLDAAFQRMQGFEPFGLRLGSGSIPIAFTVKRELRLAEVVTVLWAQLPMNLACRRMEAEDVIPVAFAGLWRACRDHMGGAPHAMPRQRQDQQVALVDHLVAVRPCALELVGDAGAFTLTLRHVRHPSTAPQQEDHPQRGQAS